MVEEGKLSRPTAVRISSTNPDEKRAIAIARKVEETPRRETRNRIIQSAIENPNLDAEKVVSEATKLKFRTITLDLTNAAAEALQRASEKYERKTEEIATEVLLTYLKTEGFYQIS